MKPPDWDRVQEIYHAALALHHVERKAFVTNACAGDPDLLREVNSLLIADDSSGDFLKDPVFNLSSESENLVGTTVDGRYMVEKELGRGGMSQVYFALDLNLQRQPVVIKVLTRGLVQDSYAQQKFDQEVEALLRIEHPGVVRVQDSGKLADGRPYIVMRYVDGETLRPQIPSEGMDLRRAASILKQIGEALEHVHERSIFHRDLKPENIILKRGTDSIVLIDFGIAKVKDSVVAESTVEGASAGTLLYMSPEQLRGAEITAASDVYSMAVIAYEMVTGRRPFKPPSAPQLLKLQEGGARVKPRQLREDLSSRAQSLILTGLSFEPMARCQSAKQFGDDLAEALLEGEHSGTRKPPLWSQIKRPLATAGSILVLALLAYGIYESCRSTSRHMFRYWLMVQEMDDGKEHQEPFKSNGKDPFETGDKFQLNVLTTEPGHLYIFNEGPLEPDTVSFRMTYPIRTINNGSSSVGANQTVPSDWITFRGPAGSENFWIVWSVSPVDELEAAKTEAFKHPQQGLTDNTLVTTKEFLKTMQAKVNSRAARYKATNDATVSGKTNMLVTFAQFKHR